MARTICSATSSYKWATCSIRSKVAGTKAPTLVSLRSTNSPKRPRHIHTMPTVRLYGLKLSKPAGRIEEKPVIFPSSAATAAAAAWSEEELKVVEQDLEGDTLPRRWSEEVLEDDVTLLTKFKSRYNLVQVLEVSRRADSVLAGSRVLLLDKPGNIHSLQYKFKILTDSYYDSFAALPPLLPGGPIAILGLAAGTAARIIHHFWPSLEIHGWEIDASVVGVGRRYFGMLDLEDGKPSDLPCVEDDDDEESFAGGEVGKLGKLVVHVGDALSPEATVEDGFAGIIVDLYSQGKVIPQLQQTSTWQELKSRLRPGGRIMVNCGGSCVEAEDQKDGNATMEETVAALMEVFPGEVSTRTFYPHDNCVAMTGAFPSLQEWRRKLPGCLRPGVSEWRPTELT